MAEDEHKNAPVLHCFSQQEKAEMERLGSLGDELTAEHRRLFTEYEEIHLQHERAVKAADRLERKRQEMDQREYRAKWQRLYEEEITLHELGETTRKYAEEVRHRADEALQARQKLLAEGRPC